MARAEKASAKTKQGGEQQESALVIVESPTKANTIRKYLGGAFRVEASVGHVRDLAERKSDLSDNDPRKDKKWVKYGVNVENHFDPLEEIYLVPENKKRQVAVLKEALKGCTKLYLATDDDREGEAISWHLVQVLQPKVPFERLVFHEITKEAINKALTETRPLDQSLVEAQRTRRVIDRLFGWDVSEVLWRKIKPGLSAGRVQSVALRLLVQRERERMAFKVSTYADVLARFVKGMEGFEAQLNKVGEQRVATGKDFDDTTGLLTDPKLLLLDEGAAQKLCKRLDGRTARITRIDTRPQTQRPSPPFTTSTLQQEANRKLRFSARQTMQVAQRLYENGFITYMRTDSVTLSEQAVLAARDLIGTQYGPQYLPKEPRRYATKSANAQEAHEAIRPAGTHFPTFAEVEGTLGKDAERLYELIWKRTVASQMPDAQLEQTTADILVDDAQFRATGRVTRFPGYLKAYVEGSDDPDQALADRDRALPALVMGDVLQWGAEPALLPRAHETRPPARLTDASLVKALEEKGIGRPSTYAAILQNLLDKSYGFRRGNALVATFMGMAVTQMLEKHMPHLVDYNFTAEMEARLDAIARGEDQATAYLCGFYEEGFEGVGGHERIRGLVDLLHEVRDSIDPATASAVPLGKAEDGEPVVVRIGRYGTFVKHGEQTASVPDETAPDELTVQAALDLIEKKQKGEAPMGVDPTTDEPIFLRNGRFGWYLQRGLASKDEGAEKPKMVSLSKGMLPEAVTMDVALAQLALPKSLGKHPKTGVDVVAHVGRYGDYVKHGEDTRTLTLGLMAATVTLEQAVAALDKPKGTQGKEHLRDIGVRQKDGKTLSIWTGRYGAYVTDGEVNRTLGSAVDLETLTVEEADALLIAAVEARTGKLLGLDPETKTEVRLLDGRFGPYLTNGAVNASLERGVSKDELTLPEAIARLRDYGKPVKKKAKGRKATTAVAPRKAKASEPDLGTTRTVKATRKPAAQKAAKAAAKAEGKSAKPVKKAVAAQPKAPPPPVVSKRTQAREEPKPNGVTQGATPAMVRRRPAPSP
jgi:DNA topoisomerase-1